MPDWHWQPDIWQVSFRQEDFSLCYEVLYKRASCYFSYHLLLTNAEDKAHQFCFAPGRSRRWLRAGWTLAVTGRHFYNPAFITMSWAGLDDSSGCSGALSSPSWLAGMQMFPDVASSASAALPAAELARSYHRNGQDRNPGRRDWLPSPSDSQEVHVCTPTVIHHTCTCSHRPAELKQKLLCLCLLN